MNIKRPWLVIFSPLYAFVTWVRNLLFDVKILRSQYFPLPVINIGNLNVGGTGKTPHTMYLIQLLQSYNIGVLSRGYGRSTKGFLIASAETIGHQIGDEPTEIKQRFPNITVAVDEKRVHGIEMLLSEQPGLDIILLDDAFQHRYVKPGLSILLTAADDLYTEDMILPGGNLRESRSGSKRADFIIVTKCPEDMSYNQKEVLRKKIKADPHQELFFSHLQYGRPQDLEGLEQNTPFNFVLVTGIANPEPLLGYFEKSGHLLKHLEYKDHYKFKDSDYADMRASCNEYNANTIITTTKDLMRFETEHAELRGLNLLHIPIEIKLDREEEFESTLMAFLSSFSKR